MAGDSVNHAPAAGPIDHPALPAAAAAIDRMLVFGGGYTGRRLALALEGAGVSVALTGRTPAPDRQGPGWLAFDPDRGVLPTAEELAGVSHVLVTIPPGDDGRDPVLESLGSLLRQLAPAWVGYLSTTGVYGDTGGAWVDETSPTRPLLQRSRERLACEQAWRRSGLPVQLLRLPAIYGPGRNPMHSLRNGTARLIHKPGQVFSRVHVDDIVGAVLHVIALAVQDRPDTLILADACPCPSSEILGLAAHLLGCKLPEVQRFADIAPAMSPMARSFWSENRRASSRRLRRELGYRLLYPTYQEGLPSCCVGFFSAPNSE